MRCPSVTVEGLAVLGLGLLEAAPDVEQGPEIGLSGENLFVPGPVEAEAHGDGPGEEDFSLVKPAGLAVRGGQHAESSANVLS